MTTWYPFSMFGATADGYPILVADGEKGTYMIGNDCQCDSCREACKFTPGWFLPGEAEKAAVIKGLSLEDFFGKYLGVNWWEAGAETSDDIFVLAPAITNMTPGEEYPGNPRGVCVFLEDGQCSIHAAKPFECRLHTHSDTSEAVSERHWAVAKAWKSEQSQISWLLGREPESEEYSGGGIFGMWG